LFQHRTCSRRPSEGSAEEKLGELSVAEEDAEEDVVRRYAAGAIVLSELAELRNVRVGGQYQEITASR
jgi:hypothetical protein